MSDAEREYIRETRTHIDHVQQFMDLAADNLEERAWQHDQSKLKQPEKSGFMTMTADNRLSELTYGSDEYRAVLREHQPTIDHHYHENDHHPEHYPEGIRSMSAMAIIEMLCDWRASTLRMKEGNMRESMQKNRERFAIGEQLFSVLMNTARELGFLE